MNPYPVFVLLPGFKMNIFAKFAKADEQRQGSRCLAVKSIAGRHVKQPPVTNIAEKRLRMRGNKNDGEEFKCKIINKNMAI